MMQAETSKKRIGDIVWELSAEHSLYLNQSEFLTSLRTRTLSKERYILHISAMYPVVVGFNRALIRSLSKLDNVRNAALVKGLAEQLQEEQIHNDMWREMLKCFEIDHISLYSPLQEYFSPLSRDSLDRMTRNVISCLKEDRENIAPLIFPKPIYPEPVLALFHHMVMIATDAGFNFWCHFGSQSALEAAIYDIVSESYCPGTVGNYELDRGDHSTAWWREHARNIGNSDFRSTEEKHMQIAKATLNRSKEANEHSDQVISAVNDSLLLFSACIVAHNLNRNPVVPLQKLCIGI